MRFRFGVVGFGVNDVGFGVWVLISGQGFRVWALIS